ELLGLIGLADPPRDDAKMAVRAARRAGIRVVMITGDHPVTARAIARELDLGHTEEELDAAVFARATAEHKLEIVRRLRATGEVVAMTGDGVNDAPAIKAADIGVAMGRSASEVTRETADMVLTDDALSGIVHAIREGRIIYANIRKTVVYLLGGNAAELLYVLAAALSGLPMPLLPLQLLWINLLGEPLPGIALSIDPPASNVLHDAPRPPSEPLLGRRQWTEVGLVATLQALIVMLAFVWALDTYELDTARTLGFSALVFGVVLRALSSRSHRAVYLAMDPRENTRLTAVVAGSVLLQLGIIYLPFTQDLFGLTPLSIPLLGLAIVLGLTPVTVIEVIKLLVQRARASREARQ
ncbi:MAG: HAD-IC family P-type ATPase, partial [Deltaproteobacteria bacterium]|nr:HAD-IC family P-type ATPase [Deltaproteobacteria bacterium]